MSATKEDSVSDDTAIIILESDDDDGDEKTDEVVFVSSTPAIISSSDSDDDDIVVIAHTTKRDKPQLKDEKTEQAVQSILGTESNSGKSNSSSVKVHPFIEATDKLGGRAPAQGSNDEDDILKAIRSIATDLEQSNVGSSSVSSSSSSLNTGSSSDYLLSDDPFSSSDYQLDLGSFSGKHPWSDLAQTVSDSNKSSSATDVASFDNSHSKSGGRGGKSSLKRSLSSGCTSSSSVPLKKRPLYATASTSDLPAIEAAAGASDDVECMTCLVNFDNAKLSKCLQGHPCCSECLQKRAKRILAQERKTQQDLRGVGHDSGMLEVTQSSSTVTTGSNREETCDSGNQQAVQSTSGELRRSLPAIIVEILEERLETDQINTVVSLANELFDENGKLVQSQGGTSSDDFNNDEAGDGNSQDSMDFGKTCNGLPIHWEQMDPDQPGYKMVNLEGGSDEYLKVAVLFHETMTFPRADIKCIKRVQNPILWQFYSVKRKQMAAANNSRPVLEKQLFHGTSAESLDPICRNGFDWRLCGTHGTMYGQGSYFAKDASYSHRYTGLGRYGGFRIWNNPSVTSGSTALIQKKLRNQRAMLKHMLLRRKIHSQLQQSQAQAPPQSVLNVMSFNRRRMMSQLQQSHSAAQPGVDPLLLQQQQHQRQQQQQSPSASLAHLTLNAPWNKMSQPPTSRLQVVIPQAHTHSSSTPPWNRNRTSYFSDTTSGSAANNSASAAPTSSSAPQMNVVQPAAHSSSTSYVSLDQMGTQPPMAHTASTPQPAVRPSAFSAVAQTNNSTGVIQIPSSPLTSSSAVSSTSSTTPSATASTSGNLLATQLSSVSSSSMSDWSSDDDDSSSGFNSSSSAVNRLKRKWQNIIKSGSISSATTSTDTQPIVIAPIDANQTSSTTTSAQSTVSTQGNQVVATSTPGISITLNSTSNITINSYQNPQCKAPQCPPPIPAHNSQNNNQNSSFSGATAVPPPAHMNMPTFMNPLTLAPPPIQLHHGALFPPLSTTGINARSVPIEDTSEKLHTMFVSRVLIGCYTAGSASLRKPPPLDPTQPYGKAYDSCVDNVYDPKVFVVFDSAQCYPEYIIEYTNHAGYIDI